MTGNPINGTPVSDAQIQEWADEAERGYDVADLKRRGRPRMGAGIAEVTTIRLDPELDMALAERAEHEVFPFVYTVYVSVYTVYSARAQSQS